MGISVLDPVPNLQCFDTPCFVQDRDMEDWAGGACYMQPLSRGRAVPAPFPPQATPPALSLLTHGYMQGSSMCPGLAPQWALSAEVPSLSSWVPSSSSHDSASPYFFPYSLISWDDAYFYFFSCLKAKRCFQKTEFYKGNTG